MRARVGMTITEAARKYHTDGATIWAWITSNRARTLRDGSRVRLIAERETAAEPWHVREVIEKGPDNA